MVRLIKKYAPVAMERAFLTARLAPDARPLAGLGVNMANNKIMSYADYEVRIMAESEGWSMVRRKGSMPFVVRSSALRQPTPRAADECPACAGLGVVKDERGRLGVDCSDCNGSGIRR